MYHTASAKQTGVTDEQIDALRFYQGSDAFDEKERRTIRFADIITRGAVAVDAEVLDYIGKFYSEDEIVELSMVIALANMVNRINDALKIEPDLDEPE
jgi:alkylhydroperoxidase family enzyme